MLKFNLTGSVQDELEKIAVEKGWDQKPGYAQIKKEQIMALQKLLNKKTSGSESGPLKVDGIWGFNTAGIYHQVKTQNPDLNLETLYGNMEPTNKQVLDAVKVLFYKSQEGHTEERLKGVRDAVTGLIPEVKKPDGFIPEKENVEKKTSDQLAESKEKLRLDKIKYLMGRGFTENQSKQQVALEEQSADDPGIKNEEAIELASQGVPVEEALKNVASNTISCLVSLADDLDSIGETKIAIAIDNQINFYKKAMDKLYDVTGETGEDFINSAHTDHVTIAPAKEEGGKIENIVEQQKKDIAIVTKDPVGKYASTIIELVKTANTLDEAGLTEEAVKVDMVIAELQKKFPFANEKLASEAASFYGKKYASDNEKTMWDGFWTEVEKNSKDLFSSIASLLTQVDSNPQGKHFFGLLFDLRKSIHNKEGELIKKVSDKRKEIVSFVQQNFSNIGIDVRDYSSFLTKLDNFSKFLNSLFAKTKEKIKSLKSTQISGKDPYEVEKSKELEDNKKNLKWTITKLINIIDEEGNRKKLYQSLKPELVSGLRQFLLNQYKEVDSLTKEDLLVKSKILWELRSELKTQGLSISEELSKQFDKTSSLVNKIAAVEPSKLEQLITKLVGGKPIGAKSPAALSNRQNQGVGYNKNLPSDEVEKLQKYLGVNPDGKYGPITHEALKKRLPQLGGNISVPENFNDVRMGNLEQVGDALRQPSSVAPGSKPSTSENVAPESNKKTKMMQWDGGDTAPISKRTTPAQQGDIVDPWGETGEAGGAEGQDQVGGAETNQEQLKKAFMFNFKKYKDLVFDYNNGFYDSLSKFEYQYPEDSEQELKNRGDDIRKIYRFLKKNEGALSNYGVDFGEMYDNLSSMFNKLRMREEEMKTRGR